MYGEEMSPVHVEKGRVDTGEKNYCRVAVAQANNSIVHILTVTYLSLLPFQGHFFKSTLSSADVIVQHINKSCVTHISGALKA